MLKGKNIAQNTSSMKVEMSFVPVPVNEAEDKAKKSTSQ
jgi:hypothetical protein